MFVTDIAAFDEIRLVERVVNLLETRLRVRPFREFLSKTAVVGVRTAIVRKPFRVHETLHTRVHRIEVESPAGKKILQWEAFGRSIGMQGEKDPVNVDVVVLLQSFNTPGTEITPGSDEVREYF